MQDFNFKVRCRPGSSNLNADGLSWQCWILIEKDKIKGATTALHSRRHGNLYLEGNMNHRQSSTLGNAAGCIQLLILKGS